MTLSSLCYIKRKEAYLFPNKYGSKVLNKMVPRISSFYIFMFQSDCLKISEEYTSSLLLEMCIYSTCKKKKKKKFVSLDFNPNFILLEDVLGSLIYSNSHSLVSLQKSFQFLMLLIHSARAEVR